jgi:hypothetical protein
MVISYWEIGYWLLENWLVVFAKMFFGELMTSN